VVKAVSVMAQMGEEAQRKLNIEKAIELNECNRGVGPGAIIHELGHPNTVNQMGPESKNCVQYTDK
jgi:hypothetical protein